MTTLTITKPDDWHLHLRDGEYLPTTTAHVAERFGRACVMPNLFPPVVSVEMALAYRGRILQALPAGVSFSPLMSLYLTENTSVDEVSLAAADERVLGFKLYPAGATTGSEAGIQDFSALYPVLDQMQQLGIVLQVHGEVTRSAVDIFEREAVFIEEVLRPLMRQFPRLKVVLEHISSAAAVSFIESCGQHVAATVTAHHLLLNRNDLLAGGLRPHHYCLPILKTAVDQVALQQAVLSGNPQFFFGSDSAPHTQSTKQSACGCAGIYSAHASVEMMAGFFAEADRLQGLDPFMGHFGALFYGLPISQETLVLKASRWLIPENYRFGQEQLVPLFAGQHLNWKIQ